MICFACSRADYLQKALWRLTAISTAKDTTAIAVRIAVNRKSNMFRVLVAQRVNERSLRRIDKGRVSL